MDGWKVSDNAQTMVENMIFKGVLWLDNEVTTSKEAPPLELEFTEILKKDIQNLCMFFDSETHKLLPIRPLLTMGVAYGFADASGSGFGSTILYPDMVKFRHGLWSPKESEESSNYRELQNLVEALEENCTQERLKNVLFILFTDNIVSEAAFAKGI